MKQFYNSDEYFLVADLSTRKLYLVNTIYQLLFKHNRASDEIPCYLYEGRGVIAKANRQFISREKLNYAKEVMPKQRPVTEFMYANL